MIYKKKVTSYNAPTTTKEGTRNYGTFDTQSTTISEVPIEDINVVSFDSDDVKVSNTKGDKLDTKHDPKELAKKLKKLKK